MLNIKLVVILMALLFAKESSQCDYGEVRVVPVSQTLNFGRVEVCIDSTWGTVCRDHWDNDDAAVVCDQLGYGRDGALAILWIPNWSRGPVLIDEVDCGSNEEFERLLDCHYDRLTSKNYRNCKSGGGAGVSCNGEQLMVKNVNVSTATVNSTTQTVMVSWKLYSDAPHEPHSLRVRCYYQPDAIEFSLWVSNETLTHVSVGGVLSSVSFGCCVSVTYYYLGYYFEAGGKCASTDSNILLPDSYITSAPNQPVITPSSTQMMSASIGSEKVVDSDLNMRASIIGGVLGSIIIILLLLLAMCGGALLFLLRSRSMTKKSSTEMAVKRNVSYLTTALTASGAQASDTVGHTPGAATEYSRIGPSYETITNSNHSRRPQQPVAGVSAARLSERYEFSEPHLAAMISAGRSGGTQGNEAAAAAMDYEVPLQSGQHEEYSHLQH